MDICFIANYYKTYFFHSVAKGLEQKGVNVYWIVVNATNNQFLQDHYESENILYLSKEDVLNRNSPAVGDFKLNELIYGDRALKSQYNLGMKFLTNMQLPLYNFIKEKRIKFVFGECTWAHELLTFRLIKTRVELGCKFLNPHTVRIPGGRFAFFEDEFQSEILITDPGYYQKTIPEDAFLPKKPDYLKLNDAILKKKKTFSAKIVRLKKYLSGENLDRNDITLLLGKSMARLMGPLKEEINRETYKHLKTVNFEFLKDKPFVLVTLHKQPEASIDVLGRYVESQADNIKDIWRQLPQGWWIVIKEHSNAVGDRPLSFYKNLLKLHNLVFVDERIDSYALLSLTKVVVTVSGTIAYEAALMGKRAIVLADVFFKFSNVLYLSTKELRTSENLTQLLDLLPQKHIDDEALKRAIYFNSYLGNISDPVSNPSCMDRDNIQSIVDAFMRAIA